MQDIARWTWENATAHICDPLTTILARLSSTCECPQCRNFQCAENRLHGCQLNQQCHVQSVRYCLLCSNPLYLAALRFPPNSRTALFPHWLRVAYIAALLVAHNDAVVAPCTLQGCFDQYQARTGNHAAPTHRSDHGLLEIRQRDSIPIRVSIRPIITSRRTSWIGP